MGKKVNYTPQQTAAILESFENCDSYEAQVLAAQNLAKSQLFIGWNTSHTAKDILAKVSSMSRPAIHPVLKYIRKPKPVPKRRQLASFQILDIIKDEMLGYNMFLNSKYIARYTLVDILKMLMYTGDLDTQAVEGIFSKYADSFDVSEFTSDYDISRQQSRNIT